MMIERTRTPSRSRTPRAEPKQGTTEPRELAVVRAELSQKNAELETVREQNREITDELAWVVKDLLRLKKKDNDDRCHSWLLSSQGLSTVIAKQDGLQQRVSEVAEEQSELSASTVNQLNEQGICEDPMDGPLLQDIEQHAATMPPNLVQRIRDALYRSRAHACIFKARIIRMENEHSKIKQNSAEFVRQKDDSAQGLHQGLEQNARHGAARRQTESTGPIEQIAIASVSAASRYSAPGVEPRIPCCATQDAVKGNEGIASVLLREREVQRKLEASQAALLEAQQEQKVLEQRVEVAETAQRAAQTELDSSKEQAKERMREVMQRLEGAEAAAAELREDAEVTRASLAQATAEVQAAQDQVQMLRAARLTAEAEAAEMIGRLEEADDKLRSAQAALQDRRLEAEGLLAEKDGLHVKLTEAEHAAAALQERIEQSQGTAGQSSAECQRLQALLTKREDRVAELVAKTNELAASQLEAQTRRDSAEASQRDSAAQLAGAQARAAKATATAEAAEQTAALLKVEAQGAQDRAAAAEQRYSKQTSALAASEAKCADLCQQLANVEQERKGFRLEQLRTRDIEEKLQQEGNLVSALRDEAANARAESAALQEAATCREQALKEELQSHASEAAQTNQTCDDAVAAAEQAGRERNEAVQEATASQQALAAAEQQLTAAQAKAKKLQADLGKLRTEAKEREAEKQKLEAQLEAVQQRLADAQRSVEAGRSYRCRAEAAEQQITDSGRAMCSLQQDLQAVRSALQESQGKAASAAASTKQVKEALRKEQEQHRECQVTCSSLQADVKNVTAALEDAVNTLQDLRIVNEKDRLQRQHAEHTSHIAEARAAEAEAQADAANARAAAALAGSRSDEKEELLRDFADQVHKLEQQSARQVEVIQQLQATAREQDTVLARQNERLARTDGELARVRLANRKLKGDFLEQTALMSGHSLSLVTSSQSSHEGQEPAEAPGDLVGGTGRAHKARTSAGRLDDHVDVRQLQHLTGKIRNIVRCLKLKWKPPANGLASAAASATAFIACTAGFLGVLEVAALSQVGRTHDLAMRPCDSTTHPDGSAAASRAPGAGRAKCR